MASKFLRILFFIGLFALGAVAQCSSYGVDYVNGGSYDIDTSSHENFTFSTIFQGCEQELVNPVLVNPNGDRIPCSAINTTPAGEQVASTCEIEYAAMTSGLYKIIISGNKIGVQRTVALTVGSPATIIITATPTVTVGITSTPNATTVYKTIAQTKTIVLPAGTVTAPCAGITHTTTFTPKAPTVTSTYTITRTVTDEEVTSETTTTVTKTAYCHIITRVPDPQPSICIGFLCLPPGTGGSPVPDEVLETRKRDVAAVAATTTVTVIETTYTATITSVTTVPAETTTEEVFKTITAIITPPPSTVCDDNGPTVTLTAPYTTFTQTNVGYSTTHVEATIWLEITKYKTSTNKASATACSRFGGWYGADDVGPVTATA
ncbi:uncharacterized protein GGS25DRAFT_533110 [Hypoxylon fragiforme]|uniref:uncharacterized protein n=1 Tax=Hypoxylon fragiforme TaxID=63214 RepID=UPI0020C7142F|nr:uncharacterized protein GGS25DRAFT_533110 [Hypoxylon fragiforme]KAI2605920.1 hypothetical protein GGS25DRAFT_533110 [Hypoxylon fragiforme]